MSRTSGKIVLSRHWPWIATRKWHEKRILTKVEQIILRNALRRSSTVLPTDARKEIIKRGFEQTESVAKIRSLRGKYKDVLTPSYEFAQRKSEEIDLE